MTMPTRLMPDPINFGQHFNTTMMFVLESESLSGMKGDLFGFKIPYFQRGLVWSKDQNIRLIESIWKGISIGTFTYNTSRIDETLDFIIIDGQQRINAIYQYVNNEFPVFGYRYSEITVVDKRQFKNRVFASYETQTEDVDYLKEYYNLMNFSGVAHKEDERA